MYTLYYQKGENVALAAYKALTHKLRKCVIELPIFICLLPSLTQKLWERFKRLPSPTLAETSSQVLFISPSCKYCLAEVSRLFKKISRTIDFVNMSNSYEIRCDSQDLWMINSSCFSIWCFCFNYFVLLPSKTESTVWRNHYSAIQTYRNNAYWFFSPFCTIL